MNAETLHQGTLKRSTKCIAEWVYAGLHPGNIVVLIYAGQHSDFHLWELTGKRNTWIEPFRGDMQKTHISDYERDCTKSRSAVPISCGESS